MATTTRLTGGVFKGHSIAIPPTQKVRPTLSRVREALFDQLQGWVPEARVLDLFCGSGAIGIEALSRGAQYGVFVDKDCTHTLKNLQALDLKSKSKVLRLDLPKGLEKVTKLGPFDLIFVDPPYRDRWHQWVLQELPWGQLLREGGRVVIESAKDQEVLECPNTLNRVREKCYGSVRLESFELNKE